MSEGTKQKVLTESGNAGTTVPTEDNPVTCECIKCGHQMESTEHCSELACPECGGEMRRAERPGPGKAADLGGTETKPAPEETENTVRIRVRDPGTFVEDSFRTIAIGDADNGIQAVVGKLKSDGGATRVQAYIFSKKAGWTMEKAQAWVKEHKKSKIVDEASEEGGKFADDVMVALGAEVKALGDGRVGGYLVRFSKAEDPDLDGDYFDADTDFDPFDGEGKSTVYYHHGQNATLKRRKLGHADLRTDDDVGVWAETQLAMRDAYERLLYQWAEEGKLGWSSGTASHLVERTKAGNAYHIDRWPLGLDASLTPTPSEPRNTVIPLKSFIAAADLPSLEPREAKETGTDEPATDWEAVGREVGEQFAKGLAQGITGAADDEAEDDPPEDEEEDTAAEEAATDDATTNESDEETETPEGAEAPAGDVTADSREFVVLRETETEQPQEDDEMSEEQNVVEEATAAPATATVNTDELVAQIGSAVTPQITAAVLKALAEQEPEQKGLVQEAFEQAEGTKSFADFLLSVRYGKAKRLREVYGSVKAQKDLSEGSGTAGGYTVPPEFLPQLLQTAASEAVVRSRAFKIAMKSNTLQIPVLDQSDAPSAAGYIDFFGGVHAYWTEEAGTKTETEPDFNQIEMRARKLAGYTQVTDELLADSAVGLEQLLMRLFGGIIGWREDYAFLRGTGAGQPLGVLNSGALVTVNRNTANNVNLDDVARMIRCFLPQSMNAGKGVWLMHPWVLPEIVQLADAASNVVWIPNAREKLPMTLFGLPIITTEKLPTLGTTGDLMLCDFSYYIIGDRGQTEIASSEHYAFINDLTTWRFVHRVDGQPWLRAPLYIDTTNQVSPFVALHSSTT